jgi:hypothetical protein
VATNSTPKKAITRNRDWREPFLLALAESGNVSVACSEALIDRVTAYTRRKTDAEFAKRWKGALDQAADLLEMEARRRAEKGVDEPVIYQGVLAGQYINEAGEFCKQTDPDSKFIPLTIKRYSDTLLIFLLKGARPKKFRDNVSLKHSGTIKHKRGAKKAASQAMADPETAGMLRALAKRMNPVRANDN